MSDVITSYFAAARANVEANDKTANPVVRASRRRRKLFPPVTEEILWIPTNPPLIPAEWCPYYFAENWTRRPHPSEVSMIAKINRSGLVRPNLLIKTYGFELPPPGDPNQRPWWNYWCMLMLWHYRDHPNISIYDDRLALYPDLSTFESLTVLTPNPPEMPLASADWADVITGYVSMNFSVNRFMRFRHFMNMGVYDITTGQRLTDNYYTGYNKITKPIFNSKFDVPLLDQGQGHHWETCRAFFWFLRKQRFIPDFSSIIPPSGDFDVRTLISPQFIQDSNYARVWCAWAQQYSGQPNPFWTPSTNEELEILKKESEIIPF